MPLPIDTSGGGSTSNFCAPTPSDMEGQINNILSRLDALEKTVSEMQGADVTATQLSDFAAQVGWVYGVTYMGTPGWIQTEAGTLIPPPGLSLSSLGILLPGLGNNPATLVSTDSDGNPVFSINQHGSTTGGGGGTSDYLIVEPASTSLSGTGLNETADISTILQSAGSAFGTSNLSTSIIDINTNGLYRISFVMFTGIRSTNGSTWLTVQV